MMEKTQGEINKEKTQIRPFGHSYARALLQNNNILITYPGKRTPIIPLFDNYNTLSAFNKYKNPPEISFDIKSNDTNNKVRYVRSANELKNRFNVVIKRTDINELFLKKNIKKFYYYLDTYHEGDENYEKVMPNDKYIVEYDPLNKSLLLKGPKSNESRIYLEGDSNITIDRWGRKLSRNFPIPNAPVSMKPRKIKKLRDQIVLGFNDEGIYPELIVLSRTNRGDPINIGIIGTGGAGKSWFVNSLTNQSYWIWNVKCCYLNDYDDECLEWSESMDAKNANVIFDLARVGLKPRPLPIIYITPSTSENEHLKFYYEQEHINLIQTLKWKKMIKNYHDISKSYPNLDLGASGRWFNKNSETLENLNNEEEFMKYLNDIFPEDSPKKEIMSMRNKIISVFVNTFFNKKLLDISVGIPSEVDVIKNNDSRTRKRMPLLFGLMYAGIIPVLRTKVLDRISMGNDNIALLYFNFLIKEFYEFKENDDYFRNEEVFIIIDEFKTLLEKGRVKEAINSIFTLGRHNNVGYIVSQQIYSEDSLLKTAKNNLSYLFCFKLSTIQEAHAICSDCEVGKDVAKELMNLGNKNRTTRFECYIFPKKKYGYDVYNMETGELVEENCLTPRKITILPPMSNHHKPKSEVREV